MKRIILITLLFFSLVVCANAQTSPSWLQLRDAPIKDVRSFGVVGDGVVDDYEALKSAVESGGIIFIPPGMELTIDAPDTTTNSFDIATDTIIIGYGATIKQKSGAFAYIMLPLYIVADDVRLEIYGLNIDGQNEACIGMVPRVLAGYTGATVVVSGCSVRNMDAGAHLFSSSGISVQGDFDIVDVNNNSVKDITRNTDVSTAGAMSATGIAVTATTGVVNIAHNRIENVLSNSALSWTDADSIYVTVASFTIDPNPEQAVLISNNFIKNWSSRAVKLQTSGASVVNNSFRLTSGTVYAAVRTIDALYGGATITGNDFYYAATDTLTLGGSSSFIGISNYVSDKQTFSIFKNSFRTDQLTTGGISYTSTDLAETEVIVSDNTFSGEIAYTLTYTCNSASKHTFLTTLTMDGNILQDSGGLGRYLIYPTGTYFTNDDNMTSFVWNLRNNQIDANTPAGNAGSLIFYSDAYPYRGYLQLSGNSGWANELKYKNASMQRILPGSSFYFIGSGTTQVFTSELTSNPFGYKDFHITRTAKHAELASGTSKVLIYIPSYSTASASWSYSSAYP